MVSLLIGAALSVASQGVDIRLEVGPAVTLPIGPFLDSQATVLDSFDTSELGLQGGVQDVTVLTDITQGTGGGLSLALLLGSWEIRYEFVALPYESVELTHLGFVAGGVSLYFATEDLLGQSVTADVDDLDPAFFHSLGFGYRFEPFPEWAVSPYVPLGLGVAIAQPRNEAETLYGANLQLGIGAHGRIGSTFDLGVAVRYGVSILKNPDTSLTALQEGATASVSTGSSAFDAAVEILQTVSISVTGAFWF